MQYIPQAGIDVGTELVVPLRCTARHATRMGIAMAGVTEDQVSQARAIDLLSYLQSREPQELKADGPGRYTTASHGSLVISNGKWRWNSQGIGGVSALDYLIMVRGMGFVSAVETLVGERAADIPVIKPKDYEQPKRWTFYPPRQQKYANGAVSYLQGRGISPDVIRQCIQAGILYESQYYNPKSEHHNAPICVFAGKNEQGEIKFAAMRGLDSDFKQDKAGSDKLYNFCIPAKDVRSRQLAVFEAPIDALSHATLQQRDKWQWDGFRLSLGGTSNVALIAFLERNPQITRITLHLDSDVPGIKAARKIKAELATDKRFSHIKVSVNPPRKGKDYNAMLQNIIKEQQSRPAVSRAALSI